MAKSPILLGVVGVGAVGADGEEVVVVDVAHLFRNALLSAESLPICASVPS